MLGEYTVSVHTPDLDIYVMAMNVFVDISLLMMVIHR